MKIKALNEIHKTSIEILETMGMEFPDQVVNKKLVEYGIKVENGRAYFTEEQIMELLKKAPSSFTLYARNEKHNILIDMEKTHYVAGYGAPKIREFNGDVRDASLDDYIKLLELVHASDKFNVNGGILVQPADIKAELSHAIMIYSILTKTDKGIMSVNGDSKSAKEIMKLMSIVFGGEEELKSKPRCVTIINSISPLKVDEAALGCLQVCCKYRQPMAIVPAPMSGSSGPISVVGNIALANAEGLALIALTQILSPGTPIIYGSAAMTSDMKTGKASIGSPQYPLQSVYASHLAKMYELPVRSSGSLTDAYGATIQAGYEGMLSLFAAREEKVNFMIHSAGIVDAFSCMSFEKFIADLEMISLLEYYNQDLEVNEKTFALDVIRDAVKTGTFMTHKHTAKRCRKDPWQPTISLRGKLTINEDPNTLMKKSIDAEMNRLLKSYKTPEMDVEILNTLNSYMLELGVDQEVLDRINGKLIEA